MIIEWHEDHPLIIIRLYDIELLDTYIFHVIESKKNYVRSSFHSDRFFFATSEIEWVNESLQQENAKVSAFNV